MAKKTEDKPVTPKQELVDETALVPKPGTDLSTDVDFIEYGDTTGTENITSDELRLPRLSISQGLSPQMTPGNSKYLDDLKLFQMFNDLTGEVYGAGPLPFVPCLRVVRRIEFIPREDGGGIKDIDVPPGDPRLEWTEGENGERIPPAATEFVEFVGMLLRPEGPEPIVLSIKTTNKWNREAAKNLTTFIKLPLLVNGVRRPVPIYAKQYAISSASEKNDQGTFGVFVVKQAGRVQDRSLYEQCKAFSASLQGKTIVVDRESYHESDAAEPAGGDTSFRTSEM